MSVHNHGIDPSCNERLVGECLLKPGSLVLDFTPSPTHLPHLLQILRDNFWCDLADQIEAQTKPPRIPEPGLWGVVEASPSKGSPAPRKWVRYGTGWRDAFANHLEWADLIDPTLIREGLS